MPRDYCLAKIYEIICNITGKRYIGSTCEPTLARRLSAHRENFNTKNSKYVSSFIILENENYDIYLLEKCNVKDKMELLQRERFFIDSLDCVNKNRPFITDEERKTYFNSWYSIPANRERKLIGARRHQKDIRVFNKEWKRLSNILY